MQCVKNMCDLLLGQIIIYRLNNRTNTYLRHEAFVTNSERHFLVKLHVNLVHNELNIEFCWKAASFNYLLLTYF